MLYQYHIYTLLSVLDLYSDIVLPGDVCPVGSYFNLKLALLLSLMSRLDSKVGHLQLVYCALVVKIGFKCGGIFFNQVFNENQVIVMLKSAACGRAGGRASTFGFRSITLVCCGLLTPNLLYG